MSEVEPSEVPILKRSLTNQRGSKIRALPGTGNAPQLQGEVFEETYPLES